MLVYARLRPFWTTSCCTFGGRANEVYRCSRRSTASWQGSRGSSDPVRGPGGSGPHPEAGAVGERGLTFFVVLAIAKRLVDVFLFAIIPVVSKIP